MPCLVFFISCFYVLFLFAGIAIKDKQSQKSISSLSMVRLMLLCI